MEGEVEEAQQSGTSRASEADIARLLIRSDDTKFLQEFFSIYLEITQKVPIFVPAEINEWYGKSDGHSLDLQRLRSLVEETGYGVRTTVTKPRLSATMKYGLSDTVIKELQDVFRRHANIRKVLIPIGDHIDRVGQVFYEAA